MKILITGCGWFGCHCATILLKHGIKFKICDIKNDFFQGSSSKNQNRLHLGFHYPRSFVTRQECATGFNKFMHLYSDFVYNIANNLYLIDQNSIVDFGTYKSIYKHERINFDEPSDMNLRFVVNANMIDGFVRVGEAFIDFRKARRYFADLLCEYTIKAYDVSKLKSVEKIIYDGEEFDYLVDCTYSTIGDDMYYETCISLIYKYIGDGPVDFAITVMDGKFWSLYPYDIENKLYTLTDVEYTPCGTEAARSSIESKVLDYIPDFTNMFEYNSYFISRKAKNKNKTDDRSLTWEKDGAVLRFSGGKIGGIFAMEDIILSEIINAR